jgi:flagellar hook-associated protein 3 FlgL
VLREIGPGVTMPINTVAREFLGDGQAAGDGKLLDTLRDAVAPCAPTTPRRCATPSSAASTTTSTPCSRSAPATAPAPTASTRALAPVRGGGVHGQAALPDRGRDIAKSLIDFNSQQAAYQSALRAGASLVQSSLLDFLR